jgi:hypothetical protein
MTLRLFHRSSSRKMEEPQGCRVGLALVSTGCGFLIFAF